MGARPVNTREKARTEPISPPALSLTFKVHTPFAFCPSKADSGLFGAKLPDGNAALVPAALHWASIFGKAPSSSKVRLNKLLLLHPNVVAGTPGLSKKVTLVAPGDVRVNLRSPIHEWFTPTVVDKGSVLPAVPSKRKFKSVIVPTPLTLIGISTPKAMPSGITTAGPV